MIEILPNWHPMLVHFSVVLLMMAGIVQIVLWVRQPERTHLLSVVMNWLTILGVIAVIATVVSGYHAYTTVRHDDFSHLVMDVHRNYALMTMTVFLLGAIIYWLFPLRSLAGLCFILALLLVAITTFHGGELVYRYGLGVMSLPDNTAEIHNNHNMNP